MPQPRGPASQPAASLVRSDTVGVGRRAVRVPQGIMLRVRRGDGDAGWRVGSRPGGAAVCRQGPCGQPGLGSASAGKKCGLSGRDLPKKVVPQRYCILFF